MRARPASIGFLALVLAPTIAAAQPTMPFPQAPVAEATLARTLAAVPLPSRAVSDIVEVEERSFTQFTSANAQMTFDNWFADTGAEMIAANLRSGLAS